MKTKIYLTLLFFCWSGPTIAQSKADDIVGTWLAIGSEPAKIQIYRQGDKYYGKLTWLQNPNDTDGKPKTDTNNPDKSKRSRSIIGLVILTDFKFDGESEWKGGDIYDPESGNTYNSYIYLKDKNTLIVRGYVGISLFGRTETWTRTN